MKTLMLGAFLSVLSLFQSPPAFAQAPPPFLGTWKLDTKDIENQLRESGVGGEVAAQRLARLRQVRWVFAGDGKATTITDGFPNSRTWTLKMSKDEAFDLQFNRDDIVEDATVKMEGPKRMLLVFNGDTAPSFKLIWESDQQAIIEPQKLTIGSKAPLLTIQHRLSESTFSGRFETGHVYLLDFWATWCPPCIEALPELARLQDTFRDENVIVVAISNESKETVAEFLARKSPSENVSDAQSFGDVMKDILVATDPLGTSVRDYLVASNQRAIPVSFIIGKTGEVEWIGHLQDGGAHALRQVVDGRWDREHFSQVFAGRQRVRTELPKVMSLISEGNHKEANLLIDELIPLADALTKEHLQQLQRKLQGQTEKRGVAP